MAGATLSTSTNSSTVWLLFDFRQGACEFELVVSLMHYASVQDASSFDSIVFWEVRKASRPYFAVSNTLACLSYYFL